jgi:hypothetical protein
MEFKEISFLRGYGISKSGEIKNLKTNKILKPCLHNTGYYIVFLKGKTYKIHRLLALMFISNPNNKPCVDHIDGNKSNNNIFNLRWATYRENSQNKKLNQKNKTGYTGIQLQKNKKQIKYRVFIKYNDKNLYLGTFDNLNDAINKRIEAEDKYHSEFNKNISLLEAEFININIT